jgi:hypothetical protein
MPADTLLKQLYILALFLLCVSCRQGQSQEFNTQTLNLKGNVKHITEITGKGTWDLEFADNQLLYVTQKMGSELTRYDFHYESKKLEINSVMWYRSFLRTESRKRIELTILTMSITIGFRGNYILQVPTFRKNARSEQ